MGWLSYYQTGLGGVDSGRLLMPDVRALCTGGRGGGFRGGRGGDRGGRGGGRGRGDFKPKMKIDSGTATGSKVTFD